MTTTCARSDIMSGISLAGSVDSRGSCDNNRTSVGLRALRVTQSWPSANGALISEELWRLEQNQVWKRVWQWACLKRTSQTREVTWSIRSATSPCWCSARHGVVRAFHNVCQHVEPLRSGTAPPRGHRLPYHRWTWDCGATSSTSRPRRVPRLRRCLLLTQLGPLRIWEVSSSSISTVRPSRS